MNAVKEVCSCSQKCKKSENLSMLQSRFKWRAFRQMRGSKSLSVSRQAQYCEIFWYRIFAYFKLAVAYLRSPLVRELNEVAFKVEVAPVMSQKLRCQCFENVANTWPQCCQTWRNSAKLAIFKTAW